MNNQVLPAGSRVRVISSGPFRGLKGTIRKVEPFQALKLAKPLVGMKKSDGAREKEPAWAAQAPLQALSPMYYLLRFLQWPAHLVLVPLVRWPLTRWGLSALPVSRLQRDRSRPSGYSRTRECQTQRVRAHSRCA